MTENLNYVKQLLNQHLITFAAFNGIDTINDSRRGVAPLLELIDNNKMLSGYSVADKVIGKAAAYLYVLLQPSEIYCNVISQHAVDVFEKYNISFSFENCVPAIRNRKDTGFCPMESAVLTADNPVSALAAIKDKLYSVRKQRD